MQIIYDSMTGNVKRLVQKLLERKELKKKRVTAQQITPGLKPDGEFVLITYTTGFGQVPQKTEEFLKNNRGLLSQCLGVAASGNRNWGDNFGASADKIAATYNIENLTKFELAGTNREIEEFINKIT